MKFSSTTKTVRSLVTTAMIAAAYCAISLCILPLSFASAQVRVAEALTLLAIFGAPGIWGVTLGCALVNLIGAFTGANLLGFIDVLFGTSATLIAAWMSYGMRNLRWRGLPVLSALPPILVNAVIIGAELCFVFSSGWNTAIFLINAAQVALGQLISCGVIGLMLIALLERNGLGKKLFATIQ